MKLAGHPNHSTSFARFAQAARQLTLALVLALIAALGTYAIARAAVALSASMTDAIIGDDGDGKADPGETIEYTVVINNSGSTDATGVEFDDNPDANTTFVPASLSSSPVAVDDTYPEIVVGNVSVNSALISYNVMSNDHQGLNHTATITAYDAVSAQGGTVSMTTSGAGKGQFTYDPPAGYTGVDTFTYTLSDNPNATSAASNRTATVSINISGMVWFIDNNAASCTVAGCGRLSNPFSTLAAFNSFNNGTGNNPAANDNIFIYESATQYTGAITLLSGQKLIGQDATASLSTITGLTPPSSSPAFPATNSGNGTFANLGGTVTLNSSVTVRGLRINSTTSTGINDPAGSISGVNVSEVLVNTSTGTAVQLSDVSGSLSFTSISANGAASGIALTNTSGSFTVTGTGSAGSGGTLQNITGSAISLTNTSSTSFSYMNLTGVGDNGVLGSGASGFTMSNSSLTNIGNTLSPDEAALNFTNLGGTSSFTNSTITNAIDDQVIVYQTGTTTLTSFTLSGNTFNGHDGDNDAIRYQGYNTTVGTVSIQGNTFQNSDGDFIQVIMENSSNLNLLVGSSSPNSFTQPGNTALAGGITLSPGGGAGWNGRLDFDIANNTISSANVQAVNVNLLKPATSGATIDGFIRNNIISNANNNFGGSIQVTNGGLVSQVTVEINGNNITGDNGTAAIYVIGDQGGTVSTGARTDVRVLNNTVSSPGGLNTNAVHLNSSTTSGNTGTIVCWDMQNNTLAGGGFSGTDTRIRQRFSAQVLLPGYGGTSADTAAVQAYITGRPNTGVVTAATQSPGGYFNGSCNQPTAKVLPDSGPSLASSPDADNASLASAIRAATPSEGGSSKALFAPTQAGGIVNVVVGTLPAGKSVTIKFQATVNGPSLPLGTTQLSTQGTVSATNGSSALTDDTAVGGSSDATITPVDRPDTSVVSLTRQSGNPTSNATVTWQIVFADAVDSLTAGNFSLVQAGGVSGASITSVTETSGPPSTTWNITANTGSGDGTLGLNLANDTGLTHDVTNLSYTGQVYTIDRTPPTVTINQAAGQSDPTGASPINFTVVFNEPVTGFSDGDVTLGGTANPTTGTVTEIAPNDGTTYNVAVSGMANDGTVTASVGAGVAQDMAGNNNTASTSGDNTVTYDAVPPSVTIDQAAGQSDPTNSGTIHFTAVFSEPVTGFATGDVTLGG
ncbi:MAG: beta strand repeat-containing protein, partial [Chloroflexota bacterium]